MEAKGDTIETSGKETNEEMKKKEGESGNAYEMMDITHTEMTPTKTDPSSTGDLEEVYETHRAESASSQSVPVVSPPLNTDEKEEEDKIQKTPEQN